MSNSGYIVIDESHLNETVKTKDVIDLVGPEKIIRSSATPKGYDANIDYVVEVDEEDVIAEGLIKKLIVINENFGNIVEPDDPTAFLLEKAIQKQIELIKHYVAHSSNVNPLIIVQLPNNNQILLDQVERWFETKGITYENGLLAVRLNNGKNKKEENMENIESNDSQQLAVIIKQSIATGWDCPRAQILVKLRDNSTETFEIQTIGRIRRMPECKHYDDEKLDRCYIFTFDEKFKEGVKSHLGNNALNVMKLFLKKQFYDISLTSEWKSGLSVSYDPKKALNSIFTYFFNTYGLSRDTLQNKKKLESRGYLFSSNIHTTTYSGSSSVLNDRIANGMNEVEVVLQLDTHKHGRQFHHCLDDLGRTIGIRYEDILPIFRQLFVINIKSNQKIVELSPRDLYAFVINNHGYAANSILKNDLVKAMSEITEQKKLDVQSITKTIFRMPQELDFTYDAKSKVQSIMFKNVYDGYLSSAQIRSSPEKQFEQFCESCPSIEWFYKNGDKGPQYLSIVYEDNLGRLRSFFPDYILSSNNQIWIIETKGGFNKKHESEDIDVFSPTKFKALKRYLENNNLRGGFVRKDKDSEVLCICTDHYSDDITDDNWMLIDKIF